MSSQPPLYYPPRMGRVILASMIEVVGRNGLNAVLNLAGRSDLVENFPSMELDTGLSFATLSSLFAQFENAYGPRGGRGLALRVGRVAFKYGLREFGQQLGLTDTTFRLLPLHSKMRTGAEAFAQLLNQETDQHISIQEENGKLMWVVERCSLCHDRHTDDAVCYFAVGFLQEAMYWLSGGKIFNVEETLCIARGDPTCTIEIDQTPLA